MIMRQAKFLKSQFERIQKEARRAAEPNGREVCGLILDNRVFFELIQVRNKTKRGGSFSFYFNEVRAVRNMAGLCDHEVVGTFHSHPVGAPKPGPSDVCNALDDSIMLIFDVMGRSASLWHIKDGESKQLPFSFI
jgi:proteasome lid subunit RPN8/RPN11